MTRRETSKFKGESWKGQQEKARHGFSFSSLRSTLPMETSRVAVWRRKSFTTFNQLRNVFPTPIILCRQGDAGQPALPISRCPSSTHMFTGAQNKLGIQYDSNKNFHRKFLKKGNIT